MTTLREPDRAAAVVTSGSDEGWSGCRRTRATEPAGTDRRRTPGSAVDPWPHDVARLTHCAGLDGLEVMSARWVVHEFAPHMHDFYAVSLNDRGRGAFDCRRDCHDAAPGTCNLIAPGELHTGRATSRKGWAYRNLYIDASLMKGLLGSAGWRGAADVRFRSPLVRDAVLAARLRRAFASLTASSSLLKNESLLLSVVGRLITKHLESGHRLAEPGWEHPGVVRARQWLDANVAENVSIRSLATVAGLSPYYLVRAFHRQVGVPPHRYQTIVRVNRSRELLRSGMAPAEAASRTGFCDQSHLTRCFRRTYGLTPGRYAASHALLRD